MLLTSFQEKIESGNLEILTDIESFPASALKEAGYNVVLVKERKEEEDRVFVIFEDAGGHKTRRSQEFFASRMYIRAWEKFTALRKKCGKFEFTILRGEESRTVNNLFMLLSTVLEEARKGINIQRYKGLGEMNPEQLWVTTMNPENRNLLQVSVEDASSASDAFEELMGDRVEARREFIERNALAVETLDI